MRQLLVSIPLFAAALAAQNYVVSPAYCTNAEGAQNNTIPFWGTSGYFRYQQPTSDLKGLVRTITELAWRRDYQYASIARTIDMQMALADTDLATFTTTFANNYANPPVMVFTRKIVNVPDMTPQPTVQPSPFTFALPLDVPFVYIGVKDILWDVEAFTFSSTASLVLDAVGGVSTTALGGYAMKGTGCTTSNGVMALRSTFNISAPANSISLAWNLLRGPASASTAVFVGLADPALPIPNLCGDGLVHTDASLFSLAGTTTSAGVLNTTPIVLSPYDPAWQAVSFSAQAASLDASQGAFPVAVSNGLVNSVPAMPTATPFHRLYSTVVSSPTGTLGTNYGLVTRFRY